jgi:hypothetical protein
MRAASSLVGIIAKKVLFSHLSPIAISENCIAPPRCVPMCGRHIALYSPKPASRHLTISQNVLPLVTNRRPSSSTASAQISLKMDSKRLGS